jgi:hypothetical protein
MNAEYFMKYQLSFIEKYFDRDIMNLEKEYEVIGFMMIISYRLICIISRRRDKFKKV